jgi:hypothetical protein
MADDSPGYSGGTNPEKDQPEPLTHDEVALLRLEQRYPGNSGQKERLIRTSMRINPVRYQQRLHRLSTDPRALAAFPDVCARVRAVAAEVRARRESRTF